MNKAVVVHSCREKDEGLSEDDNRGLTSTRTCFIVM